MGDLPERLQNSLNATKSEYRKLGNSGLRVSVPILGAMSFGDPKWFDWVLDEEKSLPLLKAAYDRGINTWDTADVYSNGASERIIGKALKKYNIPRSKVVILTKCYATVDDEDPSFQHSIRPEFQQAKDYVNLSGLSRNAIFDSVERSLERLQTSYIDLYQIHRFDYTVPIEETMLALHDLVRMGKVRYIGASSMWAYQYAMMQFCAEKNGWTKFVSMQSQYSLLYREEEREMNRFCNLTGVGLIPWSPLSFGELARPAGTDKTARAKGLPDLDEQKIEIIGRVEELANKKGWKMSQVALAWIGTRCASPIIGFSSEARMDEALDAKGKTLTREEQKYLEEPYKPRDVHGFQLDADMELN
jgi:aryl-alcohol dehydrogenase-like predicted oxidoreductase